MRETVKLLGFVALGMVLMCSIALVHNKYNPPAPRISEVKSEALARAVDLCYGGACHPIAAAVMFEAYLKGEIEGKVEKAKPEVNDERTGI
jgi:hypothetical protein